jgi:hypothetical protein
MLQVEFQEKYPRQLNLFSNPMPREELFLKSIHMIPKSIRANRKDRIWGLADVTKIKEGVLAGKLTVRPPLGRIAEEPKPGVLEEAHEPRFFTQIVVHVPLQIIAVQRAAEVMRFARSAKTFASVFYDLLIQAINKLDMDQHYILDIEPIAKTGSFVEWYYSLDKLNRISIHYVGPNLPSRPGTLVKAIRETANAFKNELRSETVDLIANEPTLEALDVEELDRAAAERKLRMRAKGIRSGIGTSWSSKDRPEPETARVPLTDEELADPIATTARIKEYLEDYFGERKQ